MEVTQTSRYWLITKEKIVNAQSEMPKYKCHKEVWALKIKMYGFAPDGSGLITPEDEGYAAFEVSKEYLEKHQPKPGGYYVVYADGYKSFSPAEAFENGYTLSSKLTITETKIKHMAEQFLRWRLPENFNPDSGISFQKTFNENTPHPMKNEPTGTNLFDIGQAIEMVRHMVDGLPETD